MTAFAYVMMAVYPIGIPVIYTYWLFFRYGKELRLLRSLESEIGALKDELRASTSLSSARMRIRGAKSVWSSSELTKAQGANSSPIGYTKPLPEAVKRRVKMLQHEKEQLLGGLPDYVQKLVLGYGEPRPWLLAGRKHELTLALPTDVPVGPCARVPELRTYYFELIECGRKLAIVCLPVFFSPSGSVSQLLFGLMVCFLTFGAHMFYRPYVDDSDDHLAQLCQVQIFFALLSSVALKYDAATINNAATMDILLTAIALVPFAFAVAVEVIADSQHRAALGMSNDLDRLVLRATETFQGLVASDDVAEAPVISPSELQVEMPESEHVTANDVNAVRRSLSVSRLAIKRSKGSRVNDSFGNNEVAKATAVAKIPRRVVIATPYWKPEGLSEDPPRANAREALETAFTLIDAGVLPDGDPVARHQTLPNDDPPIDAGGAEQ